MTPIRFLLVLTGLCCVTPLLAAEENPPARFEPVHIDERLPRAYQNALADINGDGRLDIAALGEGRESFVAWYENPTWRRRLISGNETTDHIDLAFCDIDRDGEVELALVSDFNLADTKSGGQVSWLKRRVNSDAPWNVFYIGREPTAHRARWSDLDGDGRPELVVLPIMGVGAEPPLFQETAVRVLAYRVPQRPRDEAWIPRVLDQTLHIAHGLFAGDLDGNGRGDLLLAGAEGIVRLELTPDGRPQLTRLARGTQREEGYSGSSEVTVGKLKDGRRFLASIEPWHGNEMAVYVESKPDSLMFGERAVIDDSYVNGHAVAAGDFDRDGDDEILAGYRGEGWTIYLYDYGRDGSPAWKRWTIDRGGVAVQGISVGDLDADGRLDFVAAGGATNNVMLYLGKD